MKKFFAGIAAAAIITVPMTSFALESMSKGALKKATGQAGVSIALDDIVIYQKSNPTTTYWDNDGMTAYRATATGPVSSTVGAANRTGIQISYAAEAEKVIVLDGILDNSTYGATQLSAITGRTDIGIMASGQALADPATATAFDPGNGQIDSSAGMGYLNSISPLTIDVGTCESLSRGLAYNVGQGAVLGTVQVAGVIIGLPTIELQTYHKNNTKKIDLVTDTGAGAPTALIVNSGKDFIEIEKSGHSTMAILGGRLEIAPH